MRCLLCSKEMSQKLVSTTTPLQHPQRKPRQPSREVNIQCRVAGLEASSRQIPKCSKYLFAKKQRPTSENELLALAINGRDGEYSRTAWRVSVAGEDTGEDTGEDRPREVEDGLWCKMTVWSPAAPDRPTEVCTQTRRSTGAGRQMM
ncbi:hypothetical protein C0Q70_21148 [Pomacea canaliculata]|uniref:Uncharacterized protein n=1 Tax=Pomacea canaliculata TaxID=400727 RepID=A0A2T7NBQ3_POMCA|nr:hypothetical protein C0Q70_21148 [Pomacea canaliculata]